MGGCTQRVQRAWLSPGSTLEMLWVGLCCPSMHERVEKSPLTLHGIHFQLGSLNPSLGECCWLRAMTIASLLMGGCGLSHEHVEDGRKTMCVKFGV